MASTGEAIVNGVPFSVTVPDDAARHAEEALHGLGAARPDQAIETEDFAAPQFKGNIGKFGGVRQAFDLQNHLANGDVALRKNLIDGPADHQAHELRLGDAADLAVADLLAVAQADEGSPPRGKSRRTCAR